MSAKPWRGENQVKSVLREQNIVETRPITPPCRNVVGAPAASNGLLVLPPDTGGIRFNPEASTNAQTNTRRRSADRIQRKLHSVERSNSAGGRLGQDKSLDISGVLEESKKHEKVQSDLKNTKPFKSDVRNEDISEKTANGTNETVDDAVSLEKLDGNEDLPIELKAEFLSCVMEKDFEKALDLCNEMLAIDPDNKTCNEFQNVIREKLRQEASSSDEDSEADDSSSETDDGANEENSEESDSNDDESEEDGGDEDDDEEDDTSDEDDEGENSESSSDSDSDIELPPGPINLYVGGLPLRPFSAQPGNGSGNT